MPFNFHRVISICLLFLSSPLWAQVDVTKLRLPEGFKIEIYATGVPNARGLAISEAGTVFVGTRGVGTVTALMDTDKDGKPDRHVTIASGLTLPSGVAIKDGDLYVSALNRILRYRNIDASLPTVPFPELVYDKLPTDRMHGWKHIHFGPDGRLYFGIGAPGNILDKGVPYATLNALNVETGELEVLGQGIRNTVSLDWNPSTGNIWFTENGRDMMGDDLPPCEINTLTRPGQHFGYPYIHGSNTPDPEFGTKVDLATFDWVKPTLDLGAHVAPVGIHFYEGSMFPAEYQQRVFWAEHGSWNRSSKVGYRIMMATYEGDTASDVQPFITGWLQPREQVIGRPVDFLGMKDGSLLISDDHAGVIYRVTYSKP